MSRGGSLQSRGGLGIVEFEVKGLGFGGWGLGCRGEGSEFGVWNGFGVVLCLLPATRSEKFTPVQEWRFPLKTI